MDTIVKEVEKIRVLVVEDEFFIAEWVAESLSDLGFAVETVSNARDALRCLKSASVDVLFTDINLPGGMDGAALARQARQFLPELPVIMLRRVSQCSSRKHASAELFLCESPTSRKWSGGSSARLWDR